MGEEEGKGGGMNWNSYVIGKSELGEWNDIEGVEKKRLGKGGGESVLKRRKE